MSFESLVSQLESTEAELVERLSRIEDSRKRLKAQIKDIRSTIKKFGEDGSIKAAALVEVTELIASVLAERRVCHREVLLEEVESRLRQAGSPVTYVRSLVDKALSDDRFVESEDGWMLVRNDE